MHASVHEFEFVLPGFGCLTTKTTTWSLPNPLIKPCFSFSGFFFLSVSNSPSVHEVCMTNSEEIFKDNGIENEKNIYPWDSLKLKWLTITRGSKDVDQWALSCSGSVGGRTVMGTAWQHLASCAWNQHFDALWPVFLLPYKSKTTILMSTKKYLQKTVVVELI